MRLLSTLHRPVAPDRPWRSARCLVMVFIHTLDLNHGHYFSLWTLLFLYCLLCTSFLFPPSPSCPNLAGQIQKKKNMASALTAVRRSVDPARLQALKQLQCAIFSTTYNPTNARNGAKYLKGRLRGPSMVRYYPPRITFRDIEKMLHGEFGVTDLAEQQRLDDVEERKLRGKGAPKKAKSKGAPSFSFCASLGD